MKWFSVFAARDGDTYAGVYLATDEDDARQQARPNIARVLRVPDDDDFEAELDGFTVEPSDNIDSLPLYRKLADGLSDMIENGRLREGDIPDDYRWLVELLAIIAGKDSGDEMPIAAIRAEFEPEEDRECQCVNCMWNGNESELNEVKDMSVRLDPGSVVPAGECPECGCLAYLKESDAELFARIAALRHLDATFRLLDAEEHIAPGLNDALAPKGGA